ncbi:MAG: dihydrodipicolinate synthase family protein [Actinobacteria bacterium]|nr:dihydrodipicolinate synthase family protein [Actinomycetota bacterium]
MHIPEGVIVAMLTPFDDNGRISEKETRKLVNFLIDKGVDGIFPVSSCGEYAHMDMGERKYLIDIVADENKGRVDITPGTGATCPDKSIELAKYAKQKGCSAIVLHGPYFFKNINEIVEGHLKKVALSVDISVFLYNIPFFANEITPEIAANLCSISNIVGIKDSSGNMVNVMNLIDMTRKIKPDFKVLVGAEEIMYPALAAGGNGCMTATAGILPEFMISIYKNFINGNLNQSLKLQLAILELIRTMKTINFPQGFKEALSLRGINMGKPKMEFSPSLLSNLAHTKEKLEFIMENLLKEYFPQTKLKYYDDVSDRQFSFKEIGFNVLYNESLRSAECINCGKCESDCLKTNYKDSTGINSFELNRLVEEISKNILQKYNKLT